MQKKGDGEGTTVLQRVIFVLENAENSVSLIDLLAVFL